MSPRSAASSTTPSGGCTIPRWNCAPRWTRFALWGKSSSSSLPGRPRARRVLSCGHAGATCMEHVGSSFWRSFVLAYMVRAGVAVTSRGLGLLRSGNPRDVFRFGPSASGTCTIATRCARHVPRRVHAAPFRAMPTVQSSGVLPRAGRPRCWGVAGLSCQKVQAAIGTLSHGAVGPVRVRQSEEQATLPLQLLEPGDVLLRSPPQVMYAYVMRPETPIALGISSSATAPSTSRRSARCEPTSGNPVNLASLQPTRSWDWTGRCAAIGRRDDPVRAV